MKWFFHRLEEHGKAIAIHGEAPISYDNLLQQADAFAASLPDVEGKNVAVVSENTSDVIIALLGIWRRGGTYVPLCDTHPISEWAYILDHAKPTVCVARPDELLRLGQQLHERGIIGHNISRRIKARPSSSEEADCAMMLYTSGTTNRPKGVPILSTGLQAQVQGLCEAWGWTATDRILAFLPLHHVHGLINIILCSLYTGAGATLYRRFDSELVFSDISDERATLFMGVPTIYHRLLQTYDAATSDEKSRFSAAAQSMRLWISGSAALPKPVFERCLKVLGHSILERYGMTEIGMALSNPLEGERNAGEVGCPLPWVRTKIVDPDGGECLGDGRGEIRVKGESVFKGYFENAAATAAAFDKDGWFKTGDIVERKDGRFRILGRSSIDILKSGGEKISALEIESTLLGYDSVEACAVVGVPDATWGQRIVAFIIGTDALGDMTGLRAELRQKLAPYKVPKQMVRVQSLPRNAMGKVKKKELIALCPPLE